MRIWKQAAALAVCLASAFACTLTSIRAEETASQGVPSTMPIEVQVETDADVEVPAGMSFEAVVEPAQPGQTGEQEGESAGVAGGLSAAPFQEKSGDTGVYTSSLSVNLSAFTEPGTYLYTVTLKPHDAQGIYAGLSQEDLAYNVSVYLSMDPSTDQLFVDGYTVVQQGKSGKASSVIFSKKYTDQPLTITKKVVGDEADYKTSFPFTISLTGAPGQIVTLLQNGKEPITIKLDGKEDVQKFSLKDGETLTVRGLTSADTYIVTETNANQEYVTEIKDNGVGVIDQNKGSINGTASESNDILFTNTRNVVIPTGLKNNLLPFVILLAAGACAVFMFLHHRRTE